ncbi:MAG: SAM-dependent methyltransferase, partial [Lacisediminihabitans sp.]
MKQSASLPSLGRVTLVGGGPGSEGLLTVAAVTALAEADVVLYDRLAPHTRLDVLAPHALHIDVGKQPG